MCVYVCVCMCVYLMECAHAMNKCSIAKETINIHYYALTCTCA